MNCVIYARVSTDRQAEKELSIPAQLQAMRDYARQHEWSIVREFVEPGASGKTAQRPILQELLAVIRESTMSVQVVLVHKIDRLARNVYDHATIRALLKQHQIRLVSVVENVDDTVSGQLVENIMASIAQFYSANLGEEVKKGMRQKVLNGGWPHLAPCGYVQVRNRNGPGSHVEAHPRVGPLVAEAFRLCATGLYSIKGVAARMAKEGLISRAGRPFSPSHLRKILTNPFYMGRIQWKDLYVVGQQPGLVSEEVFNEVQQMLKGRSRQRGTKGNVQGFPLRGLAICSSCRGHMTAERHGRWLYYRCSRQVYRRESCPARFCNADRAHDGLKRICLQIQITRATASAIERAARRVLAERRAAAASRKNQLEADERALLEREMELTKAFADGDLSPECYVQSRRELSVENARVATTRRSWQGDPEETLRKVGRVLDVATSLWDMYAEFSDQKRAELLRIAFETVVLGSDGVVGYSLTKPLRQLVAPGTSTESAAADLLAATEAA